MLPIPRLTPVAFMGRRERRDSVLSGFIQAPSVSDGMPCSVLPIPRLTPGAFMGRRERRDSVLSGFIQAPSVSDGMPCSVLPIPRLTPGAFMGRRKRRDSVLTGFIQAPSVSDGMPYRDPALSRRPPACDTHPRHRSGNARGSSVTRIRPPWRGSQTACVPLCGSAFLTSAQIFDDPGFRELL